MSTKQNDPKPAQRQPAPVSQPPRNPQTQTGPSEPVRKEADQGGDVERVDPTRKP